MKYRLRLFLCAGLAALAFSVTGGCCHHRPHGDKDCCQKACCNGMGDCSKAPGAGQAVDKPCCGGATPADPATIPPK